MTFAFRVTLLERSLKTEKRFGQRGGEVPLGEGTERLFVFERLINDLTFEQGEQHQFLNEAFIQNWFKEISSKISSKVSKVPLEL